MKPQLILDLANELLYDGFAGGGGASLGLYWAFGRHVDHATNHNKHALGMHRINHLQTVHHEEDVFEVNPFEIQARTILRKWGFGWFSPDCTHFSKARGGKPVSKRVRGLCLVMLKWAKAGMRVMVMENVEEITTWGPLFPCTCGSSDPKNHKTGFNCFKPVPEESGRTWKGFLAALSTGIDPLHPDLDEMISILSGETEDSDFVAAPEVKAKWREEMIRGYGYKFETKELRGCDFGAPTIRKRLFMICRNDGKPIIWPSPTHFPPELAGRRQRYRVIAECIDFYLPCPSIFLSPEEAKRRGLNVRRPLKPATEKRIAIGIDKHVLKKREPFLVSLTHQGGDRTEALTEPGKTITGAKRGEKALVAPVVTEHANASSPGKVWTPEEPLRTQCAQIKGGHFALVSPVVSEYHGAKREGDDRAKTPDQPLPVQDTSNRFALVSPVLAHTAHGEQDKKGKKRGKGAKPVTEPGATTCGTNDLGLIAPVLARDFGQSKGAAADKPAPTIMPEGQGKTSLIAPVMVQRGHVHSNSSMSKAADEPMRTQAGAAEHTLVAAGLVQLKGDVATHTKPKDPGEPGSTVTAGGNHNGLFFAYMAQHNGGFYKAGGKGADEPISTITGRGTQQQLVTANVTAYYKTDENGQGMIEPARTSTGKARFGMTQTIAVAPPMTEEQVDGARRVAAFLRKYGVEFEGEFATVCGFVIVDIGMRMLTARELFRAQGFPDSYVIDRAWVVNPENAEIEEIVLTKEQQIKMCGNSVCPQVAEAIAKANAPELIRWSKREAKKIQHREMSYATN